MRRFEPSELIVGHDSAATQLSGAGDGSFLGLYLAGGLEGATIGAHLAGLPHQVSVVERGQTDFSREVAESRRENAYMAQNPDADGAPDHDPSSLRVLVRGYHRVRREYGLEFSNLELDDNSKIGASFIDPRPPVPDDARVWVVASAGHIEGLGANLTVWSWEPAGEALLVPRYEQGLPGDLARSRLNRTLAQVVELPPSDITAAGLRVQLVAAHAPSNETQCAEARLWLLERWPEVLEALLVEDPHAAGSGTPGVSVALPLPRLVKTAIQAELYAAEFMRALGYLDAEATLGGADGGVDVRSSEAVAQVKMEGLTTGRPALQQLKGAAVVHGKAALFFSLAGYTAQAVEWAEVAEIACFEFAFDGSIEPRNDRAAHLLRHGAALATP